jgi:transposase InsO family protein
VGIYAPYVRFVRVLSGNDKPGRRSGVLQLLDKDGIADDIHLFNEKLQEWEDYYNYHRPHGASMAKPYERLVAKMSASSSPAS